MMAGDEKDTFEGGNALSAIWQRRRMVAGITVGGLALAIAALAVIEPEYTAKAMVALEPKEPELVESRPLMPRALEAAMVQTEMDILTSRQLTAQVVDQLGLARDPEFNPRLDEPAWKRDLRGWAAGLPAWVPLRPSEPHGVSPEEKARAVAVDELAERFWTRSEADSYAIQMGVRADDPQKAAQITNALLDLYVESQLRNKFEQVEQASGWMSRQVANLRAELAQSNRELAEFRQKNDLSPFASSPDQPAAQQYLVDMNRELAAAVAERTLAESELNQLRRVRASGGSLDDLPLASESQYLEALREQEAELVVKAADLGSRFNDANPGVVNARTQLQRVRAEIGAELARLSRRLENQAAQAQAREQQLRAQMTQATRSSAGQSGVIAQLQQLEQEVAAKNLVLETFVSRMKEIANRTELTRPDVRVVSRAAPPLEPSHPNKPLFMVVALLSSLGLGVALALLMERLRAGFQSTGQIKDALGLPTLGIVPQLPRPDKEPASEVVVSKPASVYAEAIKTAQLSILNAPSTGAVKRILITSSVPREGKTAFAVSLSRTLAQNGYRTLLCDCDFRRPKVAPLLGVAHGPGLAEFLHQEMSLDEVVRVDPQTGLHFAAAGSRVGDPQKLLRAAVGSPQLAGFMELFDVVVVDTPPTMVASDSAALSRICDFALYVVEWDKTPRRAVEAGVAYLQSLNVTIAGVVLSKVDMERQRQNSDYVDFCFRYEDYYAK